MSTNLFVSFDAAFAGTQPSYLDRLRHRLGNLLAMHAATRQRRRQARAVRELPPYLLRDLGVVRWDGRLFAVHDELLRAERAPLGKMGRVDRTSRLIRRSTALWG